MRKLIIIVASLAVWGCGSTGVLRIGKVKAPPKGEGCFITVYADEKDVGRPFEKLCLIDAKTGSTLYNNRGVSGAMKKVNAAACECGADAVIVQGMEKKGVSLMSWGSSKASVLAIKYTGPVPEGEAGVVGAKLFSPDGELVGTVLAIEAQHRFQDGTETEGFFVELPKGATTWVKGEQGRKMLSSPSASPVTK